MNYYGEKEIANTLRLLDKMRNEYPKEDSKENAETKTAQMMADFFSSLFGKRP